MPEQTIESFARDRTAFVLNGQLFVDKHRTDLGVRGSVGRFRVDDFHVRLYTVSRGEIDVRYTDPVWTSGDHAMSAIDYFPPGKQSRGSARHYVKHRSDPWRTWIEEHPNLRFFFYEDWLVFNTESIERLDGGSAFRINYLNQKVAPRPPIVAASDVVYEWGKYFIYKTPMITTPSHPAEPSIPFE